MVKLPLKMRQISNLRARRDAMLLCIMSIFRPACPYLEAWTGRPKDTHSPMPGLATGEPELVDGVYAMPSPQSGEYVHESI
jgi:hypothetical protein